MLSFLVSVLLLIIFFKHIVFFFFMKYDQSFIPTHLSMQRGVRAKLQKYAKI